MSDTPKRIKLSGEFRTINIDVEETMEAIYDADEALSESPHRPHVAQAFKGTLEVDNKRGVIYFHADDGQAQVPTILRICRLGPLPQLGNDLFDITHMHGHNGATL